MTDYEIKVKGFEIFCSQRNWAMWKHMRNPKNKNQVICYAVTNKGRNAIFLITEKGNYLQYVEEKTWVPFDFKRMEMITEEETND